jgi:hypothetical protein
MANFYSESVHVSFYLYLQYFYELFNCSFSSSDSGLENRQYGSGDPLRWPRDALYQQKLAPTSPTSGDRSGGIVRLWTKATEFVWFFSSSDCMAEIWLWMINWKRCGNKRSWYNWRELSRYSNWLLAEGQRDRVKRPYRVKIFLFSTSSSPVLGPIQPPIQWVTGSLSPEVKWLGREADHLPTTIAEVKNTWIYTSTHMFIFMV